MINEDAEYSPKNIILTFPSKEEYDKWLELEKKMAEANDILNNLMKKYNVVE